MLLCRSFFFFFQAEDGIRDVAVTGVQTCALPIYPRADGGFRPDVDPRAVHVGDPASDREAEPGPVGLPAGRVAAIEALEHMRQLLGGDADEIGRAHV